MDIIKYNLKKENYLAKTELKLASEKLLDSKYDTHLMLENLTSRYNHFNISQKYS